MKFRIALIVVFAVSVSSSRSLRDAPSGAGSARGVADAPLHTVTTDQDAAFLVFLAAAIAFEPRFTGVRWKPSLEFARRARIPLCAAHVRFVGLIVMMAAPLSLRCIRYLNPSAFLVFRVASVGSIVMTILLAVAFNRGHTSLRLIER